MRWGILLFQSRIRREGEFQTYIDLHKWLLSSFKLPVKSINSQIAWNSTPAKCFSWILNAPASRIITLIPGLMETKCHNKLHCYYSRWYYLASHIIIGRNFSLESPCEYLHYRNRIIIISIVILFFSAKLLHQHTTEFNKMYVINHFIVHLYYIIICESATLELCCCCCWWRVTKYALFCGRICRDKCSPYTAWVYVICKINRYCTLTPLN